MLRPMLLTLLLLACTTVLAQETKKPLTNEDVVTMVKGGLPEDTIVLAIERSPGKYDTSPQALIALKQQGVSQKILDVLLRTGQPQTPDSSGAAATGGVFFQDFNGKLTQLTSPPTPESKSKTSLLGGLAGVSSDTVDVYAGAEALIRISVSRPEFIVRDDGTFGDLDPRTMWIVALDKKKKTREIRTTTVGWEVKTGVREKDRRDVIVTRIQGGWKIVPKGDLSPGEYFLTLDPYFTFAYEFGIDPPKERTKQ